MAKYIIDILQVQLMVVLSWGFHFPVEIENGLMFKVNGFLHKGWVKILYNQGTDLFDITLLDFKQNITKEIEGIYFDELVGVIDNNIERVENYETRVKQEYSLLRSPNID